MKQLDDVKEHINTLEYENDVMKKALKQLGFKPLPKDSKGLPVGELEVIGHGTYYEGDGYSGLFEMSKSESGFLSGKADNYYGILYREKK
jgi:hypothetical protein